MSVVQAYNDVASVQVRTAPAGHHEKRDVALEITPIAPGRFAYAETRTDTGEAIWRWPLSQTLGFGDRLNIIV